MKTSGLSTLEMRKEVLREIPLLYDEVLLLDRTRSRGKETHNIIWAYKNDQINSIDDVATSEIRPELIQKIVPRALKSMEMKRERTQEKAEVFTPLWVVKIQNDTLDQSVDDLETYVKNTWLEITCGEAPYMVSRYHMEDGSPIVLENREGFVDRKMRRINCGVDEVEEWQRFAELAYKASYGFEWSGDSLLLARENLLFSYYDYFTEKWNSAPSCEYVQKIARIISYNVFQMDGRTNTIPLLKKTNKKEKPIQLSLFLTEKPLITSPIFAHVMNWETEEMETF